MNEIPRRRRLVLLAAVAAVPLALVVVEVALRIAGFRFDPPQGELVYLGALEELARGEDSLLRPSVTRLWEHRPGGRGEMGGVQVAANEDGFRGTRVPVERRPGRIRVACLGESSTFGWGVEAEDAYPALLGAELAAVGRPAEVLNAGVIGYTAFQGLVCLREAVVRFQPDLVLTHFGAVSEHFPAHKVDDVDRARILEVRARWAPLGRRLRTLRSWQAIERVFSGISGVYDLRTPEEMLGVGEGFRDDANRWKFGRRLEPPRFREALVEIARTSAKWGGRTVFLFPAARSDLTERLGMFAPGAHAAYREETFAAAAEAPASALDLASVLGPGADESAFLDVAHLGPVGHRRVARALALSVLAGPGPGATHRAGGSVGEPGVEPGRPARARGF